MKIPFFLGLSRLSFVRFGFKALLCTLVFMLVPALAQAQATTGGSQPLSQPLTILLALASMALLPIAVIMMTSFVKVAVVMSLTRTALGTQQIPPNQVITGLAMILTLYIMAPVARQIYTNVESLIDKTSAEGVFSQATIEIGKEAVLKAKEPMRKFLLDNTDPSERSAFYQLAQKMQKVDAEIQVKDNDFVVLVPAFVVGELAEAFKMGFIIFLPFLIVDMVVANILLALGMFQLSPVTVSLPFKLLLFVMVQGWDRIAKSLVYSYHFT